ncbi:MAG TPA: hypothetical protein VFS13_00775 [Steroidobacteraceae bacterium]|nr:hypothetical protein [Steroidobacteraceae bacterium]
MERATAETLNITQQVLRNVVIALCAEMRADMSRVSAVLAAAGAQESLEPAAQRMLTDLAEGLAMLGGAGTRRN